MNFNFKGITPESWCCIDCGMNTAPGIPGRVDAENAARSQGDGWKIPTTYGPDTEVYCVHKWVWQVEAGMEGFGGCLCVGCLEKRIGRKLKPKDFDRDHPFIVLPGTSRLLKRRDGKVYSRFLKPVTVHLDAEYIP